MKPNLAVVIDHLRPFVGDFAEDFTAMTLSLVNRRYVNIEPGYRRLIVTFTHGIPDLEEDELLLFLEILSESLERVVGAHQRDKIMVRIKAELVKHFVSS